jgi:acylphosphatase
MAVLIDKRTEDAPRFQQVITKNGCIINVRLGIHAVENCPEDGLILLQLTGEEADVQKLLKEVNELQSVRAKVMKLDF